MAGISVRIRLGGQAAKRQLVGVCHLSVSRLSGFERLLAIN